MNAKEFIVEKQGEPRTEHQVETFLSDAQMMEEYAELKVAESKAGQHETHCYMTNECGYSKEWQPYIGDYDKFEYDIRLKDGTIVENCYPNAGYFNSISDEHDGQKFSGKYVVEIRFSEKPRFGINDDD